MLICYRIWTYITPYTKDFNQLTNIKINTAYKVYLTRNYPDFDDQVPEVSGLFGCCPVERLDEATITNGIDDCRVVLQTVLHKTAYTVNVDVKLK